MANAGSMPGLLRPDGSLFPQPGPSLDVQDPLQYQHYGNGGWRRTDPEQHPPNLPQPGTSHWTPGTMEPTNMYADERGALQAA